MASRWRYLQESSDLLLDSPSVGLKLLEDCQQLINPAIGRGNGRGIHLKPIRLPAALAAAFASKPVAVAAERASFPTATIAEPTFQSKVQAAVDGWSQSVDESQVGKQRYTRGRGRGRGRPSPAAISRPAGLATTGEAGIDFLSEDATTERYGVIEEVSAGVPVRVDFDAMLQAGRGKKLKRASKKNKKKLPKSDCGDFLSTTSISSSQKASAPLTVESSVDGDPLASTSSHPAWPVDHLTLQFENLSNRTAPEDFLAMVGEFGTVVNHHFDAGGETAKAFVRFETPDTCEWVLGCLDGTSAVDGDLPMKVVFANIP